MIKYLNLFFPGIGSTRQALRLKTSEIIDNLYFNGNSCSKEKEPSLAGESVL